MREDERVSLRGVKVYPFTSFAQLLEHVNNHKGILVAINAEKILHATEQTRGIINRNIGYCDGVGAVMAMKRHGHKDVVKMPGCELWLKIAGTMHGEGKTFYLVGGRQEIVEQTVARLQSDFPGIRIAGFRNGYIRTDEERRALIEDVARTKSDAVFVAMGSPRQELLMEEMATRHRAVYMGLGGSFDVYTGNVKRAPKWWVEHNLEFAYRLLRQPSRIKRQIHLLRFYVLVKLGRI